MCVSPTMYLTVDYARINWVFQSGTFHSTVTFPSNTEMFKANHRWLDSGLQSSRFLALAVVDDLFSAPLQHAYQRRADNDRCEKKSSHSSGKQTHVVRGPISSMLGFCSNSSIVIDVCVSGWRETFAVVAFILPPKWRLVNKKLLSHLHWQWQDNIFWKSTEKYWDKVASKKVG